jgi:hypothetical protein
MEDQQNNTPSSGGNAKRALETVKHTMITRVGIIKQTTKEKLARNPAELNTSTHPEIADVFTQLRGTKRRTRQLSKAVRKSSNELQGNCFFSGKQINIEPLVQPIERPQRQLPKR